MCYGGFQESQTSHIDLPDDDPEAVKAIIQYLYSGNFTNFGIIEWEAESTKTANELADLYIATEKYQLQDLKALVVRELEPVTDVEARPLEFLTTAEKIYGSITDPGNVYHAFFGASAALLPRPSAFTVPLKHVCLRAGSSQLISLSLFAGVMENASARRPRNSSGSSDR